MYKKLIAAVLALAVVFCGAVPAFAAEEPAAPAASSTVSADPFMPAGTEIPVLEEEADASDSQEENVPLEPQTPENTDSEAEEEAEEETEEEPAEEPEDKKDNEDKTDKETEKEKKERLAAEKYRNGLSSYIRRVNPNLSKKWTRTLAQHFINAGEKHNLDPTVLMAMAQKESTFRSKVTNPYGIKGMMQTSDSLAKKYGYTPSELYEAKVSIDVASRYLKSLKKTYGTYTMALCGYMYGGYNVSRDNYTKTYAWNVMNIRDGIKEYLKKNDYV